MNWVEVKNFYLNNKLVSIAILFQNHLKLKRSYIPIQLIQAFELLYEDSIKRRIS